MATVVEYGVPPPIPRDTRSNRELFESLHTEIVDLGPRGALLALAVFFSSTAVFFVRGTKWLYQKAKGYA